jgi:hypothetical protein
MAGVAVHRLDERLPLDDTEPRRSLGRLVLSLDDLAALQELLNSFGGAVEIRFNGGLVDDPDDLATLSDSELKWLHFVTDGSVVVLSGERAFVATDDQAVAKAVLGWAERRVDKAATRGVWLRSWLLFWVFGCAALFAAITAVQSLVAESAFGFWFGAVAALLLAASATVLQGKGSFAVVLPVRMTDARSLMWSRKGQRQSFWMAFLGLVLAFAAIVVPLVIGK